MFRWLASELRAHGGRSIECCHDRGIGPK